MATSDSPLSVAASRSLKLKVAGTPAGFQEIFDDKALYGSSSPLPSDLLNAGWNFKNNSSNIFLTNALEISDDPAKTFDGTGKCLVIWREADDSASNNYVTDGILTQYRDGTNPDLPPTDRLYVKFNILFQPGWTSVGQSKLFRIRSYDGLAAGPMYQFFEDGNSGPAFIWDWSYSDSGFGVRNFLAFRGDPQETYYYLDTPQGFPRTLNTGDASMNFDGYIREGGGGIDGTAFTLIDKTTGSVLEPDILVTHEMIYGDTWNTIEFYFQMNSAPGVEDGVIKQRINGQLTVSNSNVVWMGVNSPGNKKWNSVDFGGNNLFQAYPVANQVSEWCSIDNIEMQHDSAAEGIL